MNQLPESGRDWFALQRTQHDCTKSPYTFEQFLSEVTFQIERKIKKQDNYCFDHCFTIGELKVLIEKHQFPLVSPFVEEQYLPLLTFHGTDNVNCARSITKNGYFLPNDIHPTEGFTFKARNGACFGEGIYSSTVFETSSWFSFIDAKGCIMLFVNLVFLGQVHQIANDPTQKKVIKTSGYNAATETMWENESVKENPCWDQGIVQTIHGKYGNGADTRMRADGHIVVSGNGKNVIPVALLTLFPNWDMQKMKIYLQLHNNSGLTPFERFFETKEAKEITFYRICDDWHVVKATNNNNNNNNNNKAAKVIARHIMIVDLALLRQPAAAQQIANLYGAFASKQNALCVFDSSSLETSSIKVCSFESINGFLAENVRCVATNSNSNVSELKWQKQFLSALQTVFEYITNSKAKKQDIVFNLYIFLNRVVQVSLVAQFVEKYAPLVETARQIGVKLIFTNEYGSIDFDWVNRFKNRLQTVTRFESLAYHVKGDDWSTLVDTILEENRNEDHQMLLPHSSYKIPHPLGIVGEGFVVDLENNPLWNISSSEAVLFKGYSPLKCIFIDEVLFKIKYVTQRDILTLINDDDESWIMAKKRTSEEIAARRTKRRDAVKQYGIMLAEFSRCIVRILCRFRAFMMRSAERFRFYEPAARQLCETAIREIDRIEESEELRSFCDVSRLTTCCYEMQRLLSDVKVFSGVSFSGALFDRLMNMKFAKSIVKRADSSLKGPNDSFRNVVQSNEKFVQIRGRLIELFVPASALVEPWNVVVKSLSASEEFCARDAIMGNKIILPDNAFGGSDEEKWMYAHFFTANPNLFLPGQPRALLTTAWIRCLELFFRRNDPRLSSATSTKETSASTQFTLVYDLSVRVSQSFAKDAQMADLIMRLGVETNRKNIAAMLTEGSNVISPCKLLGALLRPIALPIFDRNNPLYPHFAFALLAECVMRSCRAYLRSQTAKTVKDIVRSVLGIDETNYETYRVDLIKATQRTGNFYLQQFTNCSPFAVVAALGFIRLIHDLKSKEEIFAAFESSISMRNFLLENSSGAEKDENLARKTQLALFLQGIRYHKSSMRQNIVFNADQIIRESILEQQVSISTEQKAISANASRKTIRLARRMAHAKPFVAYHKHVKLFTPAEVDEFNARLGAEKKREWAVWDERSSLLRHHCCYPECPDYLRNFSTEEDLKNNTRKGIMGHLQYDSVNQNYIPRFHMMAKSYATIHTSLDEFVDAMDKKFRDCSYYKGVPREFLLEELCLIFERFHRK